jgi:predicted transposase YbfD/YdcC
MGCFMVMEPVMGSSFIGYFSELRDPRQHWKVVYPLPEVLLVVLCGHLAGAEDFVEIAQWGEEKLEFLRSLLPFERGIPAHDTLNDVFNALDHAAFSALFSSWVASLTADMPELVAIDGKTSRRAHASGGTALHMVSAFASATRLVLGQQACEAKSNEITAIPLLLEKLNLTGALVSIDAMGCQTKVAQAIIGKGADYLLALKDNQRSLAREVEMYFADQPQNTESFESVDADHGRIETRRACISTDVDWLIGAKRASTEPRFPALAAIGKIERITERKADGITSRQTSYYILSVRLSAEHFAKAVRGHWAIENNLHWVMDVVFHDDLCRLRTGNGPQNMALIRHAAQNMIQTVKSKASLKVRRKRAAWSTDFLKQLLANQQA